MDAVQKSLQQQVMEAGQQHSPLNITGGGSKSFYGREPRGAPISTLENTGIVAYSPSELVMTAKSGTALAEIQAELQSKRQLLGFEPPALGDSATLGGAVSCGLSGPARPYLGPVNHHVLGIKMINGKGEILRFGGQVIKNVAGFDVSRLLTGAMGCLGVVLEVSFKVLPGFEYQTTRVISHDDPDQALQFMNRLAGQPLPLSGASWYRGQTRVRLSGSEPGVSAAVKVVGGATDHQGEQHWTALREHRHRFFDTPKILVRAACPPATPVFGDPDLQFIEWGGGQRWLHVDDSAHNDGDDGLRDLQDQILAAGGHWTLFRNANRDGEVFSPLEPAILKIHQRLKQSFDPSNILNPGRMYRAL